MTSETKKEFYCQGCNKGVGERWIQTCPFCHSFGKIASGSPLGGSIGNRWIGSGQKPQLLSEVSSEDYERISTGTREFDRVLGGGIVTGSTVLLSGDPGIGKSTLLLQVAIDLSMANMTVVEAAGEKPTEPLVILYVSAEETTSQIKGRALRVSKESNKLYLHNECDVVEIGKQILEIYPDVVIIDSIQTLTMPTVDGAAGSVTQVRECALFLVDICKRRGVGCFLVCHVTKDGAIAGPKTLEHLVDAVLEFHKEGTGELRSIRANKNRFGDTNELALFRMTRDGLHSIENPSELLLSHHKDGLPGVCIGFVASGPRPLAVEFQSLLGPSSVNGTSLVQHKRVVTGFSTQRATQVIAILQRRLGLDLSREIFLNVPGGLEDIKDPALDLPLALALASFALGTALPKSFVAFGEIGLAGEVRPVTYNESRIKAAKLMGFKTILGPVQSFSVAEIDNILVEDSEEDETRSRYLAVATVQDAFDLLDGFDITPPPVKESKVRRKKNPLRLVDSIRPDE
jgi:DNA repair protein RadA/Sms